MLLGCAVGCAHAECGFTQAVFADMHDGDQKQLTIDGDSLTIKPFGNNETWVVNTQISAMCTATIDFNVPGKPNPPPISLLGTIWQMASKSGYVKRSVEFTDPTSTLAPAKMPLNEWIMLADDLSSDNRASA